MPTLNTCLCTGTRSTYPYREHDPALREG